MLKPQKFLVHSSAPKFRSPKNEGIGDMLKPYVQAGEAVGGAAKDVVSGARKRYQQIAGQQQGTPVQAAEKFAAAKAGLPTSGAGRVGQKIGQAAAGLALGNKLQGGATAGGLGSRLKSAATAFKQPPQQPI